MVTVTRKDAEKVVALLAEQVGVPHTNCFGKKVGADAKIGCLMADCNPIFGGCNLEEILTKTGGVGHPLGSIRMKPADFVRSINSTRFALEKYCKTIKKR